MERLQSQAYLILAASAVLGYGLGQESIYRELATKPGEVIGKVVPYTEEKNPKIIAEAIAVEVINQYLNLDMMGMTISNRLKKPPTRCSIHLNVYSRLAAFALWVYKGL